MYAVATPRVRGIALAFAAGLGLSLAAGFLPTARALEVGLAPRLPFPLPEGWALPALALFFWLTIRPRPAPAALSPARALRTLPVPVAIAALFGLLHPAPGVREPSLALWLFVCVPLGEEWLFRGWVPALTERLWPQRFLTDTNPFPVSVWAGAVAFSLWHLQNAGTDPSALVAFQVAYTLVTGLWLGWLRWRTGRIYPCTISHLSLNVAAGLW